jgi:hypothetical protein
VPVTIQKISDDLNKIRCPFSFGIVIREAETKPSISGDKLREKIQKWLSPPDPSINHNTACEAHHDGTAACFLEGPINNEWKETGSLLWTYGNRTVFFIFSTPITDGLWFRSGVRQEHSLVGDSSADLC